jgi:outer membrane protein OmpA-like peptidoglycan-associated protein
MRNQARRRHIEEEEESSFVSMTDMTVSFLFIVMILLAFFASQLHNKNAVPRSDFNRVMSERDALQRDYDKARKQLEALDAKVADLEARLKKSQDDLKEANTEIDRKQRTIDELTRRIEFLEKALEKYKPDDILETYLKQAARQRAEILRQLQSRLKTDFPKLEVSAEVDALRFKGDGLFAFNSSDLSPESRKIVEVLADRLGEILPCYTLGKDSRWEKSCNPVGAVIEAVQVEGHTDADGPDNANLELSTQRANATFFAMTSHNPELARFLNTSMQPVLSVAGYGKMRPIADNATIEGRATNRRIDLRIIMYTPYSPEDIRRAREALEGSFKGDLSP